MKKITLGIALSFLLFSCGHNDPEVKYEENKVSLEVQEKSNPIQFLSSDGTYRKTLLGNKEALEGTITNKATVASYKDIQLAVTCKDENGNELGNQTVTIFETVGPNSTINFKTKVDVPKGTSSLGWEISNASVSE